MWTKREHRKHTEPLRSNRESVRRRRKPARSARRKSHAGKPLDEIAASEQIVAYLRCAQSIEVIEEHKKSPVIAKPVEDGDRLTKNVVRQIDQCIGAIPNRFANLYRVIRSRLDGGAEFANSFARSNAPPETWAFASTPISRLYFRRVFFDDFRKPRDDRLENIIRKFSHPLPQPLSPRPSAASQKKSVARGEPEPNQSLTSTRSAR